MYVFQTSIKHFSSVEYFADKDSRNLSSILGPLFYKCDVLEFHRIDYSLHQMSTLNIFKTSEHIEPVGRFLKANFLKYILFFMELKKAGKYVLLFCGQI